MVLTTILIHGLAIDCDEMAGDVTNSMNCVELGRAGEVALVEEATALRSQRRVVSSEAAVVLLPL